MTNSFVVVYEGQPDFITATELADRVLVREVDWLDESLLDSQRQWLDTDPNGRPMQWKSVGKYALEVGIRKYGHFDGRRGEPDAIAARKAIAYVRRTFDDFRVIILVRDADNQTERLKGLEQARAEFPSDCTVLAVAIPKRECWIICGFDPKDDNERQLLEAETEKLGTNPCLNSHDLRAGTATAKRNPKRVLAVLTGRDWERQRQCWLNTDLAVLENRGQNNGLADYFNEIKTHIAPLLRA